MLDQSKVKPKKLLDGYFISYSPVLAKRIGRNQAIFLEHLNYWFENTTAGKMIEGTRFVYNTLEQWTENLDMSEKTLSRTINKLTELGLLKVRQLAQANRTKFYAINYAALKKLVPSQTYETRNPQPQQDRLSAPTGQPVRFITKNTQTLHNTPPTPPPTQDKDQEPLALARKEGEGEGEGEDFQQDIEKAEKGWQQADNRQPAPQQPAPRPRQDREQRPGQISATRGRGQAARVSNTTIDRLKNWKPNKQQLEREANLQRIFANVERRKKERQEREAQWAM